MTAKRFTIENDIEMKDNWNINKRCYHFGNGFDAKDCCNMLNELQDENTMLKERRHEDINDLSVIAMKYKALEKENEQLKQQSIVLNDKIEFLETILKETDEDVFYATKKITEQMTLQNKKGDV